MRGDKIKIVRAEALERMIGLLLIVPVPPGAREPGPSAIMYRLDDSGRLGGYDPNRGEGWSWSYGNRVPTTDCVGAVCAALGLDRRQHDSDFPEFGGHLNCESIWLHARNTKIIFRILDPREAAPGDLAVVPGRRGLLRRIPGHVEMVLRPATGNNPPLLCGNSPRHKATGQGIGVGAPWSPAVEYVRYHGFDHDEAHRGMFPYFRGRNE
jgi:hypothetical protein